MQIKLVSNWKQGWKWFSSWAFAFIIFTATVPFPNEILQLLPEKTQQQMIAWTAVIGWLLQFVNQGSNHG